VLRCKKGPEIVPMTPINAEKGSRVATPAYESGNVDLLVGMSSTPMGGIRR
jgi:hypothetical protein